MSDSLDTFLSPASVAILGASPEHTKLRGRLTELIIKNGYRGRLYLVNPGHREIRGLPCHGSIADVPEPVDLAVVVVPADKVVDAVEECAAAGARNALILSSGFAEAGAEQARAQERIGAIARRTGMRICGPNAEGFHNELQRISATFSPAVDLDADSVVDAGTRRCGVIAQSGGIGFSLYHGGRALGLRFTHVITVGNEVDLSAADFLEYLVDDPGTAVIVLFLETIRDPRRFLRAADRAARARKPIVVLKAGRSTAGSRATASHTGSMAGWDAAYDAVFTQFGMTVVDDPARALAIAGAFATCPLPRGRRAAVLTVSGGGGALMADALSAAGLELPELRPQTQAAIKAMIPFYGTARNPVDVTGQATRTGAPLKVIEQLAGGDEVDLVVAVTTMSNPTRPPVDPEGLAKVVDAQRTPVLFYTYTVVSPFGRQSLASAKTLTYQGVNDVAAAARALVDFAAFRYVPPLQPPAAGSERIALPAGSEDGTLPEYAAKALLARHGLPVAPHRLVRAEAELEEACAALAFPVAVKIQSPDIPHKTEAGGVRLDVANAEELRAARREVLAAAGRHAPQARIAGVLVEEMAAPGVEIIVGIVRDPTFGPVLTVGAGGVATELYRDVTRRLAPVTAEEAQGMLRQLRSFPLLSGYRGAPAADLQSLARLIATVSELPARLATPVAELELNPVIVHRAGHGCSIVDALVVVDAAAPRAALSQPAALAGAAHG